MKLGRTSLEAMSILVLGYHGDTSLATVARGLNFTENHIFLCLPQVLWHKPK